MNNIQLTAYRIYVLALGNLLGGGLHDTIRRGPAWFSDPIAWVRGAGEQPGSVHPFFYTSGLLTLTTLVALALMWTYRGPGRKGALVTLAGTLVILVVTYFHLVPASWAIYAHPAVLSDAEIIRNSRMWLTLDVLRQLLYIGFFYTALVALGRFVRKPAA